MNTNRRNFMKKTLLGTGFVITGLASCDLKCSLGRSKKMNDKSFVTLRGHHLTNLRKYIKNGLRRFNDERIGYTAAFAKGLDAILEKIANNPSLTVRLVDHYDDICNICPFFQTKPEYCLSPSLCANDRNWILRNGFSVNAEYPAKTIVEVMTRSVMPLQAIELKNGKTLTMRHVIPPVEGEYAEYAEKIILFFEHVPEYKRRYMKQLLQGDYESYRVSNFHVGEFDGKIAGLYGYNYSRHGAGVVGIDIYVNSGSCDQEIYERLTAMFCSKFKFIPGCVALYDCVSGQMAKICLAKDFQAVIPGTEKGLFALMKKEYDRVTSKIIYESSFETFEKNYYQTVSKIDVSSGSMGELADIDMLLKSSGIFRKETGMEHLIFNGLDERIPDYMRAVFMVEDGKGIVTVAKTKDHKVIGWGFLPAPVCKEEDFVYELHPNYIEHQDTFKAESLRIAKAAGF